MNNTIPDCDCQQCRPRQYPELNVELLDKTLDHIKTLEAFRAEGVEMEEQWNQGSWGYQGPECGTAMCFAGWACKLAGKQLVVSGQPRRKMIHGVPYEVRTLVVADETHPNREVSETATELLGLTAAECSLYDGSNTLEDLEEIVDEIKAGSYRHGKGAA